MICSTKTENLTAVEGYIMADRRNLFFFMVMTKQRSLKNETNLSYFRREWIYHIRSSKMQTLSSVLEMMQPSYKPFVKLVLEKIVYTQDFYER